MFFPLDWQPYQSSFPYTGSLTKAKELKLSNFLLISRKRTDWFMPFPRATAWKETRTASTNQTENTNSFDQSDGKHEQLRPIRRNSFDHQTETRPSDGNTNSFDQSDGKHEQLRPIRRKTRTASTNQTEQLRPSDGNFVCIYQTPPSQAGFGTWSIFKPGKMFFPLHWQPYQSSFPYTGSLTKAKELKLSNFLLISRKRTDWFMPFPRATAWKETRTASTTSWTSVAIPFPATITVIFSTPQEILWSEIKLQTL